MKPAVAPSVRASASSDARGGASASTWRGGPVRAEAARESAIRDRVERRRSNPVQVKKGRTYLSAGGCGRKRPRLLLATPEVGDVAVGPHEARRRPERAR